MGYEDQAAHDSGDYAYSIRVRDGHGEERTLNPALVVYVWGSKGIAKAAADSVNELARVRPDAVALHGGTADIVANLAGALTVLRVALDDGNRAPLRWWVGVGIDGTLDAWHAGKLSAAQVVARHVEVAKAIARVDNVEVIALNGEGKWAIRAGSTRSRDDVRALADAVGRAYKQHAPDCVLALSSFGALGYHSDVRAMIEGLTPHCSAFTGQSYAARPGEVARGVLPKVLERDERSQEATERQGWLRPDEPSGENGDDSPDDLDRVPTIQAHKCHPTDLCRVAVTRPHVLVWSVPTIGEGGRADEEGLAALQAASAIRAEAGTGPDAVRKYQRQERLTVDGSPGPVTRAHALGVP